MAKLIVHYKGEITDYPINDVVTVGRQTDNTIRLPEGKSSRYHARITPSGGDILIEDLGSANGTRVNGRKVKRCTLRHGDTIQIGNARIQFEDEEQKQKTRAPKSASTEGDPLIGQTLGGYQILSVLGRGGMGTVYKATQLSMDRTVALKVMKKELSRNRQLVKSFLQEARAAGQLTHPALVQVHDFGDSDGTLFLSMELIEGETVNDILRRKGKLSILQSIEICISVAEGLESANRNQIVHQDVKPHNIMLDKRGNVKLADLGLATMVGRTKRKPEKKTAGPVMGTPHYMAPEQSQREEIDSRTDLYALGGTLFQMVTGRVPFDGPNCLVILTKHITEKRPDPREFNVTVPDDLAELIMRLMAVDKADRPASPKDVVEQLKLIKKNYGLQEASAAEKKKVRSGVVKKKAILSRPQIVGPSISGRTPRDLAKPSSSVRKDKPSVLETGGMQPIRNLKIPAAIRSLVFAILLAACVYYFVNWLDRSNAAQQKAPHPDPAAQPKIVTPPVMKNNQQPESPVKLTKPADQADEAGQANLMDPEALKDLDSALEARDRAFQSGNFSGAQKALHSFLGKHTSGTIANQARNELRETMRMIDESMNQNLKDATAAAQNKKFRLATAKCTRIISADPQSGAAVQARTLMGKIDMGTERLYNEIMGNADKSIERSQLDAAIQVLGDSLDELGGTKWAEPLSSRQFRLLLANQFLKKCDRAAQNAITAKKPVEIIALNLLTQEKVPSILLEIKGLLAKVQMKNTTIPHKLSDMTSDELYQMAERLDASTEHLGFANLLLILNRKDQAHKELLKALAVPNQAEEAARQSAGLSGVQNLHSYDFSKWQDQSDWEASLGAWATTEDQYVLESPEGGDTRLKPDAIGGPFPGRDAHINFEFKTQSPAPDYYVAAEFGTEQNNVTVLFNAEGVTLMANAQESVKAQAPWQNKGATKAEIRVKGDTITLMLNGTETKSINAPGASELQGSLAFRVRETACIFDNIVLRNMK